MFTIDKITEKRVREAIKRGEHLDGRDLMEFRPIYIEKGFSPVAEGSALVRFGDVRSTKVLAGVKCEVEAPYEDSPDEGFINVMVERMPYASPFKMRELDDEDIIISRVVDRIIRSSEAIPFEELVIEVGKHVWGIYVEMDVLDDFGNVMDAAGLAAMAALMDAKMPIVRREGEEIILDDSERVPLKLLKRPVTISFYRIDGHRLVDPLFEEEHVADIRLTFGVTERGEICGIHKSGPGLFTMKEFEDLVDNALRLSNYLRKRLERILKIAS